VLTKENGEVMNFVRKSARRFIYSTNCRKQPGFRKCFLIIEKVGNLWKLFHQGVNRTTGKRLRVELYQSDAKYLQPELKFWTKV